MIRLGLRLVLSGGREAITRLVVLAVAVGLGVGLLLTAVAGDQRGHRLEQPPRMVLDRHRVRAPGPGGGHRPAVVASER